MSKLTKRSSDVTIFILEVKAERGIGHYVAKWYHQIIPVAL